MVVAREMFFVGVGADRHQSYDVTETCSWLVFCS